MSDLQVFYDWVAEGWMSKLFDTQSFSDRSLTSNDPTGVLQQLFPATGSHTAMADRAATKFNAKLQTTTVDLPDCASMFWSLCNVEAATEPAQRSATLLVGETMVAFVNRVAQQEQAIRPWAHVKYLELKARSASSDQHEILLASALLYAATLKVIKFVEFRASAGQRQAISSHADKLLMSMMTLTNNNNTIIRSSSSNLRTDAIKSKWDVITSNASDVVARRERSTTLVNAAAEQEREMKRQRRIFYAWMFAFFVIIGIAVLLVASGQTTAFLVVAAVVIVVIIISYLWQRLVRGFTWALVFTGRKRSSWSVS